MLSQWSVIWVGNTFPQGDAGLLRLLAVRNDLGPAPSNLLETSSNFSESQEIGPVSTVHNAQGSTNAASFRPPRLELRKGQPAVATDMGNLPAETSPASSEIAASEASRLRPSGLWLSGDMHQ